MLPKKKTDQVEGTVSNPLGKVWGHPGSCDPAPLIKDGEAGLVMRTGRTKVAIVGFAGSTKEKAPYNDPEYEIWGLNQLYRHIPRADRWFDIHANYDEHVVEGTDHIGWIQTCSIPVYMNRYHPEYPSSVRFPIERAMGFFGQKTGLATAIPLDYYTSTVAFMLALAIMEEFETIAVYGIDLIVGTEWSDQKPCVEYYLGYAAAKGIHLEIPVESALLKQAYRYGYSTPAPSMVDASDFKARKVRIEEKKKELETQLALLDGAAQEDAFWANVWTLRDRGGKIDIEA